MDSDRRSLPRRFDDERNGNCRPLAIGDDLPVRCGYIVLPKRRFRANLVESQLALRDPISGIGDAALFQDALHLAVFTERSVERDEGEVDTGRQFEIRTFHIDLRDLRAQRAQCLGDSLARGKRDVSLRAGPAHQHRNLLVSEGLGHASSPTICTSVSNSIPRCVRATSLILSINSRTSAAVAPPSLMIKFP